MILYYLIYNLTEESVCEVSSRTMVVVGEKERKREKAAGLQVIQHGMFELQVASPLCT